MSCSEFRTLQPPIKVKVLRATASSMTSRRAINAEDTLFEVLPFVDTRNSLFGKVGKM